MSKKIIRTDRAPAPVGPYAQAIDTGALLFCSGQIAIDPATDQVERGSISEQTTRVMANIEAVLGAAGLTFAHVVKTTIYLRDMADFAAVNTVYARSFPGDPPARSTVAVAGLPKDVGVEIEVIASRA